MSYSLTRTSMALDASTIQALKDLSEKWQISKAEVIRRAVRQLKQQADREEQTPSPLEALDWLQNGGGLVAEEAAGFRAEVTAGREARKFWWEA
jgi:Ribbon-helix-helix protein, copG family